MCGVFGFVAKGRHEPDLAQLKRIARTTRSGAGRTPSASPGSIGRDDSRCSSRPAASAIPRAAQHGPGCPDADRPLPVRDPGGPGQQPEQPPASRGRRLVRPQRHDRGLRRTHPPARPVPGHRLRFGGPRPAHGSVRGVAGRATRFAVNSARRSPLVTLGLWAGPAPRSRSAAATPCISARTGPATTSAASRTTCRATWPRSRTIRSSN